MIEQLHYTKEIEDVKRFVKESTIENKQRYHKLSSKLDREILRKIHSLIMITFSKLFGILCEKTINIKK